MYGATCLFSINFEDTHPLLGSTALSLPSQAGLHTGGGGGGGGGEIPSLWAPLTIGNFFLIN